MADWAGERVGLASIPPGQPWRDGYVESFTSRVRDKCFNINIFWALAEARVVITDWKEDYNQRRRHSSLCYQPPMPPPAPDWTPVVVPGLMRVWLSGVTRFPND